MAPTLDVLVLFKFLFVPEIPLPINDDDSFLPPSVTDSEEDELDQRFDPREITFVKN